MSDAPKLCAPAELETLVVRALTRHGTSEANARLVAGALVAAERDGQKGHGLSRVSSYCAQAASGKVDGGATPSVERVAPAALRIDAKNGFAYPALALAVAELAKLARETGLATAAVHHSHHCGVAGFPVERLAEQGLIGLMLANSPKAIAPWGGRDGVFGTNPIAFAAPRAEAPPLVIDLSLSKVARGKVMAAAKAGEAIPEGWALDSQGRATNDPQAALEGTMVPLGDAKGAALALMVEILAASLTGAHHGFEASSFFTADGPAPAVGQLLIAVDPGPLSAESFAARLEILIAAIEGQEGTRLPGNRRLVARAAAQDGIAVPQPLFDEVRALAEGA